MPRPAPARGVWRRLGDWASGFTPAGATGVAAAVVIAVAAADVYAGTAVDMTLLYLVPVGFGAFFAGLGAGVGLAALAAASSIETQRLAGGALPPAILAWNTVQQLGVFLMLAAVLDAFKRRLLHEQQAARTDPLTSLANRRAFVESAWTELERCRRHGRPLSLLYLDCDDFKAVNDRLGHVGGDAVLAAVGATLRDAVRGHDTVARLGGDEFGVATFTSPPASVDEMILRADGLMYEAKRSGKDGWRAETWGATGAPA